MIDLNITSETNRLRAVMIHEPGNEVENMTPATAERALYSDILNLSVASREYKQFKGVLQKFTRVVEISGILKEMAKNDLAKQDIIRKLSEFAENPYLPDYLNKLETEEFCRQVIEGISHSRMTLTNFLKREKYRVSPLHNFFFTRDSSFTIANTMYSSAMATRMRSLESMLINTLFSHYKGFKTNLVDLYDRRFEKLRIEGGDVLIVSPEVLLIGIGKRTSTEGVDQLIRSVLTNSDLKYVLIQELPHEPESFIHLDMVFTFLSHEECMIYEPLILGDSKYHTVLMSIEKKAIVKIDYVGNILEGLRKTGNEIKPLRCGGGDEIMQEREQWHSGANFLALDNGKVIGYERNIHTAEELSKNGYKIIKALDVINKDIDLDSFEKTLITIEGSELSRGGGGPRCMSMPLIRD